MLQICLSPLGPHLHPGHFVTDDGPNPGTMQSCNWDCRWCRHPWTWWQRPRLTPAPTHAGHQRTWTCLQWQEMHYKTANNHMFWLDLWQGWCTPGPLQGHHHSQHAGPRDTLSTARVPWHGHIPVSLCALSLFLYSTPPWPAEEGCWVHLEWNIPKCLHPHQEPSMFQHTLHYFDIHRPVIIQVDASKKGLGAALLPCCLCIQSTDPHWTMLCQHRAWAAHLCLWHRVVPHICLWLQVQNREWPQIPWADYAQEPGRCTSLLLWVLLHLQDSDLCIKYGPSRAMLIVDALSHYAPLTGPCNTPQHFHESCPHHATEEDHFPGCHVQWSHPLDPSTDDPLRLARGYMWCSHGSSTIPPCLWYPYSGRWHHPMWWSSCHPPLERTRGYSLSMKATKEYPNANTILTNVLIGLASIKTSNVLLKHALHINAIAHRNHNSHSWHLQPLNAHGNTLEPTSCTSMAMSTSSSLNTTQRCPLSIRYLHPNAMPPRFYPPWRNCSLSMAFKSHLAATMAPVCQYPLCRSHCWLELWPLHQCTSQPS